MDKNKYIKKVSIYGIFGNIFLLLIKSSIAFVSKSQAMIADTVNSATDIFASLMTYIGNKIASEPNDETHNLGHGKAEYIFSMFISLSMMVLAFKILMDSIKSIISGNQVVFSWFLFIVCIITIMVKLSLFIYCKRIYSKSKSILVLSNMNDHRNDCALTTCTLLSIMFSLKGIYWIDGVVGTIISIWIFFTGVRIFIESYNVLMDKSIDEENKNKIIKMINKTEGVQKVDEIYSTPIGQKYVIVFTIYVDGEMSTFNSHEIADKLQRKIEKLNIIDKAIIHVNPTKIDKNDKKNVDEIRKNDISRHKNKIDN